MDLKVTFAPIPLQEFLNHEFSAENITFWTSCEQYRHLTGGDRKAAASAIAERHLAPGCPEPVNVDAVSRQGSILIDDVYYWARNKCLQNVISTTHAGLGR